MPQLVQAAVLLFVALYVPLAGWRLPRRLGLYLVVLYVFSQVAYLLIEEDVLFASQPWDPYVAAATPVVPDASARVPLLPMHS